MTINNPDIEENLRQLRLHYTADHFFEFVERMKDQSTDQILDQMAILELTEKKQRTIQRRLSSAHLGRYKHLEEFDWDWPKSIDRRQVEQLLDLNFLEKKENIILIGAQGLGKTMIAKNIALFAIQRGKTALFTPVSKMVTELAAAGHQLEAKLRKYARPDLLVLDELGYLAFQDRSADLLYEVMSRRYERSSTIITTNLAFKDWPTIFPGASCVVALVDRVTHNAEIIKIDGPSYRQKESKKRQQTKKGGVK